MSGAEQEGEVQKNLEAFSWRVRPSDHAPGKTLGVAFAAILAFGVGTFLFKDIYLGLIGFAIIFGSTAEFWLGTAFRIDDAGATARTGLSISTIKWDDVKRVVRDARGIKLSPLEQPGKLDAFRGVYLRYGDENRDSIERAVITFGKRSDDDVVHRPDGGGDGSPDQ